MSSVCLTAQWRTIFSKRYGCPDRILRLANPHLGGKSLTCVPPELDAKVAFAQACPVPANMLIRIAIEIGGFRGSGQSLFFLQSVMLAARSNALLLESQQVTEQVMQFLERCELRNVLVFKKNLIS